MPKSGRFREIMKPKSVEAIVQRAQRGEKLSVTDRLRVLDALDSDHTTHELAAMLNVSVRTVRRDRARLRALAAREFESFDLAGELWREYRYTLERIDEAIRRGDHKAVRSLALRWGVVDSFAKLAVGIRVKELAELLERLKARVASNGHLVTTN
jgi:hypothetical protein